MYEMYFMYSRTLYYNCNPNGQIKLQLLLDKIISQSQFRVQVKT